MQKMFGEEKPPVEDVLSHYGVIGMKWGIRRGKAKSGVGRIRGAAAQALMDESRRRNTAARLGRAASIGYGYLNGNPFRGPKGQMKVAARQQESAKRILAGKTTTKDFLRAYGNMHVMDLIITTTPKKGATGYNGR